MKKLILVTMLSLSPFIYANDEEQTSFFAGQAQGNNISTVDDPDPPTAPINESAYILLLIAAGTGFVILRNKSIKIIR